MEKNNVVIYVEKLPRKDLRLGRNVFHDSRSLNFPFNTSGLEIIDVVHERYVPIFNQGQLGSCTGNAGIGAISSAPFKNMPNSVYTRDENGAIHLYSDATLLDPFNGAYPPNDTGSNGLSIAKALKNAGLIDRYDHTFTLQDALKAGSLYAWITGTNWYAAMFSPDADGRVHPVGELAGGHEYKLKAIDTKLGRIWFENSWGTEWGVDGCFYMTWEDFNTLLMQSGDVTVLIPVTTPIFTRTLRLFNPLMRGDDVKGVQTILITKGFLTGTADGIFGEKTKKAVIAFQHSKGLRGDGVVGKVTQKALVA